jgi:hypothetical protein
MALFVLRQDDMDRSDFVLAVLTTAGGSVLTPVQVQKLFFVLDRRIPEAIQGPRFNFTPYDYGPFDADVYREIEGLADRGLGEVIRSGPFSMKTFRLTPEGQSKGEGLFKTFDSRSREFISNVSTFVRTRSFKDLVSAIYKAFPDMKVNSVFRES